MHSIIFRRFFLIIYATIVFFFPQLVFACSYQCPYDCTVPCPTKEDPKKTCASTCYETCYDSPGTPCGTQTRTCTVKTNCWCTSDHRQKCDTDTDKTCTSYCNGSGTCNVCAPDPCDQSFQGTNADGDAYDMECGDCDDNNPRVYPGNPNEYCDCNYSTPSTHPSGHGIPELTDCGLDSTKTQFKAGCLCLDGKDNDCDGLIDMADSDCPDPTKDWVIDGVAVTLYKDLAMNGGVWVINGGSLTIPRGITLTINKVKGLHVVGSSSSVDPESEGRIKFQ